MGIRQLRKARISARLKKIPLGIAFDSLCLVANFLKQRFEFTLLHCTDQVGIIGFNPKLVDWHRQFQMAVQIDHLSVVQDLAARISELLASPRAFHFVDVGQQRFESAEFTN